MLNIDYVYTSIKIYVNRYFIRKIKYSIPESHTILLVKIITALWVCKLIKSTIVMQWYEILLAILVIIIVADIRGKIFEFKRNYFRNDSWRTRKKRKLFKMLS